jgi:hypothetical protein
LIKLSITKNLGFVLYIFCFIFAPPVIPKINLIFLVFLYSLFQLLIRKRELVGVFFRESGIKKFCAMMLVAYTYIMLVMAIGIHIYDAGAMNYIKTIYRFLLIIPITITCILYLIIRSRELEYTVYDVLHSIIKAGVLQSIISITMFLSPTVKQIIIDIMFTNTGDELVRNLWVYQRRLYAFSNSVLDSFGYGTGIIAAIPIYLASKRTAKYLLYTPILLVVPFLNSRTGLVVFLIGLVIAVPMYIKKSSFVKIIKTGLILVFLIVCAISGFQVMKKINPITTEWVENGLISFLSLINIDQQIRSIEYTESANKLFSSAMWDVPNAVGFIFGTGHNVYEAVGFSHSDVGYINDLWLGGVIGVILLYSPLIYFLLQAALKVKDNELKFILLFLCTSFFVTNVKGYMINYNVGMAITLSVLFCSIYYCNVYETSLKNGGKL